MKGKLYSSSRTLCQNMSFGACCFFFFRPVMCRTVNMAFVFILKIKKSIFFKSLTLLLAVRGNFVKIELLMKVTPGKILSHQKLFNSVIILKNEDTQQYVGHSQKSRRSFRKFAVLSQHKRIVKRIASNSSVDLNGRICICIHGGHHS
jgi:hypothetical protein